MTIRGNTHRSTSVAIPSAHLAAIREMIARTSQGRTAIVAQANANQNWATAANLGGSLVASATRPG